MVDSSCAVFLLRKKEEEKMYSKKFIYAVNFVLEREKNYVNDPKDPGRATNLGITHKTYDAFRRKHGLSTKDVKHITKEEAIQCYYEDYWKKSGADKIKNPIMSLLVFDSYVQHYEQAKKIYAKSGDNPSRFLEIRWQYYKSLSSFSYFGKGWKSRMDELHKEVKKYEAIADSINLSVLSESDKRMGTHIGKDLSRKDFVEGLERGKFGKRVLESTDISFDEITKAKKGGVQKLEYLSDEKIIKKSYPTLRGLQEDKRRKVEEYVKRMFEPKVKETTFHKIPEDYVNKETGENKVFTKEQIDSMSKEENEKNLKAINYQKKEIGVPTKREADVIIRNGGMIHVSSYVRRDGTKVRDYYRTV